MMGWFQNGKKHREQDEKWLDLIIVQQLGGQAELLVLLERNSVEFERFVNVIASVVGTRMLPSKMTVHEIFSLEEREARVRKTIGMLLGEKHDG